MSRRKFEPTAVNREVVKALLRCGVPLANCLPHVVNPETGKPLAYNTFVRAFNDEIVTAVDYGNAMVTRNLYRIATAKGTSTAIVQAAIFWARSRAGWKVADVNGPGRIPEAEAPDMVGTEERARQIIAEELARYGSR
jgi:hypothetical protein